MSGDCRKLLQRLISSEYPKEDELAEEEIQIAAELRLVDLGPSADSALFSDIARAILQCRLRNKITSLGGASQPDTLRGSTRSWQGSSRIPTPRRYHDEDDSDTEVLKEDEQDTLNRIRQMKLNEPDEHTASGPDKSSPFDLSKSFERLGTTMQQRSFSVDRGTSNSFTTANHEKSPKEVKTPPPTLRRFSVSKGTVKSPSLPPKPSRSPFATETDTTLPKANISTTTSDPTTAQLEESLPRMKIADNINIHMAGNQVSQDNKENTVRSSTIEPPIAPPPPPPLPPPGPPIGKINSFFPIDPNMPHFEIGIAGSSPRRGKGPTLKSSTTPKATFNLNNQAAVGKASNTEEFLGNIPTQTQRSPMDVTMEDASSENVSSTFPNPASPLSPELLDGKIQFNMGSVSIERGSPGSKTNHSRRHYKSSKSAKSQNKPPKTESSGTEGVPSNMFFVGFQPKSDAVTMERPVTIMDPSTAASQVGSTFNPASAPAENVSHPLSDEVKLLYQEASHLKSKARKLYLDKKYKESVIKYTAAIVTLTKHFTRKPDPWKDIEECEALAPLYGNRAAGLIMIGAFEAAVEDCTTALLYLKDFNPLSISEENETRLISRVKPDGGLSLMSKLLARKGRAYLRAGMVDEAEETFNGAIRLSKSALACHEKIRLTALQRGINLPVHEQQISQNILNQSIAESELNREDVKRVRDAWLNIRKCNVSIAVLASLSASKISQDILPHITAALTLSPGSSDLREWKVACLERLRKWTDIASFCEQSACQQVETEDIFTDDLVKFNPFPYSGKARYLTSDALRSRDDQQAPKILDRDQVGEVAMRIAPKFIFIYLRALRLEERIPEALKAMQNLGSYPIVLDQYHVGRLRKECDKANRTCKDKEKADQMYHRGEYLQAADQYASVLRLDGDNFYDRCHPWDIETAGGRLHAVLHCNRAACLMALKNYVDAAKECNAALKLEPRYMKAILRRARCMSYLDRFEEAMRDYQHWLDLVDEARGNPNHANQCRFDRASDIPSEEKRKVLDELSKVKLAKAQAEEKNRVDWEKRYAQPEASSNNRQGQGWYHYERKDAQPRPFAPNENSSRSKSSQRPNVGNPPNLSSPSSDLVTCFYAVLQVSQTSNQDEIKKSYRRLALKYHPDKNTEENAADVFRKIQAAYEVLSDEEKRKRYDVEKRTKAYARTRSYTSYNF